MDNCCPGRCPPPIPPDCPSDITFMPDTCGECTDTIPFPQPQENFSLTNYVEIFTINSICTPGPRNQIEMIRYTEPPPLLKSIIAKFNIFETQYVAYRVKEILSGKFKIEQVFFSDEIKRNNIYFFLNRNITCGLDILDIKFFDAWQTKAGTAKTGSVYFPEQIIRFPLGMPSRYKVFR